MFTWTADTAAEMIEARGAVCDIGQVTPAAKKWLEAEVKAGNLIKYRGYWDTLSPVTGLGPLKTIWVLNTAETRDMVSHAERFRARLAA